MLLLPVLTSQAGGQLIPQRIFPESSLLDKETNFLNGHTARVPTAAAEEEESSVASIELIQQTRKPEFSSPGIQKKGGEKIPGKNGGEKRRESGLSPIVHYNLIEETRAGDVWGSTPAQMQNLFTMCRLRGGGPADWSGGQGSPA